MAIAGTIVQDLNHPDVGSFRVGHRRSTPTSFALVATQSAVPFRVLAVPRHRLVRPETKGRVETTVKNKQRLSTLLVSDLWSQDRLALALLIAATLLATLTPFLLLLALSLAVFLFLSLLTALTTLAALLTALLSTLAALLATLAALLVLLVLVLLVWHFNYSFV